jgi:hypothetical protein
MFINGCVPEFFSMTMEGAEAAVVEKNPINRLI